MSAHPEGPSTESAAAPELDIRDPAGPEEVHGSPFTADVPSQLQKLVIQHAEVNDFLLVLCEYSAALAAGQGVDVDCALALARRRRALVGMGNTERARTLNALQQQLRQGPGLAALQEKRTVVLADARNDPRWPEFGRELQQRGVRSMLAIPLELDEGAAAAINFFASSPDSFTPGVVEGTENYARQAQSVLRLAVRLGVAEQKAQDLQEAMQARTSIDVAVGVIMAQQRCSQEQAFAILSRAASARNQKVRSVAQGVLENLGGKNVATHFDE